jgi:disulfide bond formation protein DsbB
MKKIDLSKNKYFWLVISIFSFSAFGFALFAEHVLDMQPCYLCIYQRLTILFIGTTSLLTSFLCHNKYIIRFGCISYLLGSFSGIYFSSKLVFLQAFPPEISFCSMGANRMIETFGWLESLPMMFSASDGCAESSGNFLMISFEEWTLLLFIINFILANYLILIKLINKKIDNN